VNFDLAVTFDGVKLTVNGYSDKLDVLLKKVLHRLFHFEINELRFENIKEHFQRSLQNREADQPYQHASYWGSMLLLDVMWSHQEKLAALEMVTAARLAEFFRHYLSHLFVEGLIYGNCSEKTARALLSYVETLLTDMKVLPLAPSELRKNREVLLPDACHFAFQRYNQHHPTSALECYLQTELQSVASTSQLQLMAQILLEPCFDQLRTKEQLGYIVFCGVRMSNSMQGLRIIVQSDQRPAYLEERVEAFLEQSDAALEAMPQEEFERHKTALITVLSDKPKKMSAQSALYWGEVACGQYNFTRQEEEVAFVRAITHAETLAFYRRFLAKNAVQRHKLCVHILSKSAYGAEDVDQQMPLPCEDYSGRVITNRPSFKQSLPLAPMPKPAIVVGLGGAKL